MTGPVTTLSDALRQAIERRAPLRERLEAEGTDGYRLFHGSQEGAPGVTVDRYGDLVLVQSFHDPLSESAVDEIGAVVDAALPGLTLAYNDRSGADSRVCNPPPADRIEAYEKRRVVRERGVSFYVAARHRGNDPWLFLDLRAARRAIMEEASGKSVLNLFAYTCATGVAAAVAGAQRVLNVDFSKSALAIGADNAERNGVHDRVSRLASDVFPAVRQLAGIRQAPVDRGRRLPPFPHVPREQFDIVVLDPPPLAKSPFGVVDVVRDYQGMLRPALAAVADGGVLYCTNNASQVDEAEWHEKLRRCAQKHGRPIRSLDVIRPDEDFPSQDDRPPLKIARLS